MIRGSVGAGWCTADTPSGWRSRRPAGCFPTWRRCWVGSPAITPARCTRATPCTASCTSKPPGRPSMVGCWGCGRWSMRSAIRRTRPTGRCWTGGLTPCISESYRQSTRTMVGVSSASSTWAASWGSSGLACLTGLPDGPPDFSRAHVLARAEEVATAVRRRTGIPIDPAGLLAGRAGLLGLTRRGRVSAGGATRLLPARDGWCAITLSRPDDVAAVPALLETDATDEADADPWPVLRRWAATRPVSAVTERACLLDIPAAALDEVAAASPQVRHLGLRA